MIGFARSSIRPSPDMHAIVGSWTFPSSTRSEYVSCCPRANSILSDLLLCTPPVSGPMSVVTLSTGHPFRPARKSFMLSIATIGSCANISNWCTPAPVPTEHFRGTLLSLWTPFSCRRVPPPAGAPTFVEGCHATRVLRMMP
eukprot:1180008-Prorocentrum_minimum.AAC.1